jgi:hypothetical protein
MRRLFPALFAATLLSAPPAAADEIVDLLNSAIEAYEAGDIQFAIDEVDQAKALLNAQKVDALSAYLPPAPDGWTVEIDTEMAAMLGMFGGGVGTEAIYRGDGQEISLTLMADNAMVAQMGAMLNNAAMMGMTVERIGRQKFAVDDGQMSALVANRILVQAEGADVAAMTALLEQMDFRAMATFGM